MKKLILLLAATTFLSGCSLTQKTDAIQSAAKRGEFKGLDKNGTFAVSLPRAHSGPYNSIDQLNFVIEQGTSKEQNASAIIGKSNTTDEWEVLMVMIDKDGQWINLPKSD